MLVDEVDVVKEFVVDVLWEVLEVDILWEVDCEVLLVDREVD
jgi:hypothetical protein